MRKFATRVAVGVALALPTAVQAQLGVAARIGTLGLGAEAAYGLSDRVVVRGGIGLSNIVANTEFDAIPVEVELPDSWSNVGVDLYLNNAFRVGGGVLFKSKNVPLKGTFSGSVDIGGQTLTRQEVGQLTGSISSYKRAPYALIGFGKHTSAGFGLSLDVGAAFLGTPAVALDASGGTYPADQLRTLLDQEEQSFEADMKTYLKIWPVLSLGLRFGLG